MITTVCKISYGSQTVPPIVPAVQGDTGRAISFEIADFTPPAGATATYFILKPSGEAIYNSATITDNSILCELTAQSLAEAGENRMQVRVLQGEDIVTSFEVILMVRTFLGDDAIESGTEMNIFDQAVEQATEQFQENAEQIAEEVIESIPADYTALTEEVDELNERLLPIDNMLMGYNKRYSGADIYRTAYDLTIGKTYRITNNRNKNCSFAIFDSSDTIVHNYGTIVANSSITIDAAYTGATMGGYASGGYDITIEVVDDPDLLPYKVEENRSILVKENVSIPFEMGGYNVTTGAPVSITYAIRSALPKNIQFLDCDGQYYYELLVYNGEIGVSDNFIGIYQGDGTISDTNTRLSGLTDLMPLLVTNYNIAIMAGRKDNQSITTAVAENIKANNGCVLSAFNSLKTAPCYNSSPNIIYQCRNVDSTKYPPYTKYYIKSASDNQYDRVRFNVRKTTDGYYFLCHDDTINSEARNSDGSVISSSVSANGKTLAELNSYDWGIKYGEQYAGLGVPMLDDALFYSALYNLGVTIEISSIDGWTSTDSQNIVNMFNKYGVSDDLILIDPSGFSIGFLANFVPLNPKISYYLGTTPSVLDTAVINRINTELKTDFNKIYITEFPFGTYASDNMIKIANDNGWILYNSFTMSLTELLDDDNFNHGYRIIEANNVRNVKDTVRAWANSKVSN